MAGSFPPLPRSQAALIRELLHRKRARDDAGAFVIEGTRPVIELVQRRSPALISITTTREWLSKQPGDMTASLKACHVPIYELRHRLFAHMSALESAQGVLAVVRMPDWAESAVFDSPHILGFLGDRLQDPNNVGTLIRLAAAFGMTALWLTPDSADVFSPKIVRATAGTVLTLPIFRCLDARVFVQRGCAVYAATVPDEPSIPLRKIRRIPPRLIAAFGNETHGLSPDIREAAAVRFHIPLKRQVESLNVASAAAVAAFYFSGLPRGIDESDRPA